MQILIIGLGNPGKKYANTRHNAGFMLVDYFWENFRDEFGFSDWEENKKLKSILSFGKLDGKKIILAKPQTFMNLSGGAVATVVKYHKVKLKDLFVVHDEIDLPLGIFRFSAGSSSAGHQGVQNIIEILGTQDFTRLRIGVDNRGEKKVATEKYVLGKFTRSEKKFLNEIIKKSCEELLSNLKSQCQNINDK